VLTQDNIDDMFKWAVKNKALEVLKYFLDKGVSDVVLYAEMADCDAEVKELLSDWRAKSE
jgi:hypothetical protein